jgi:N6-L-threonylcarbamoyladenine synthase
MIVLGIETSCDETSVAIVGDDRKIYSHLVFSQLKEHKAYGGVVPEIASRSHLDILDNMVAKALDESGLSMAQIDAIAVTGGPGLIGGVLVGVMYAKGLASAAKKKFIALNHLEGHALSARLIENTLQFPFMLLLVSGGHCQIIEASGVGQYKIIGSTIDDAVGEAFDKVAKMMGLPYPGGPQIEQLAKNGDPHSYKFPLPLINSDDCNFSFSGLKTAVKRTLDKLVIDDKVRCNIAASFQYTVSKIICTKVAKALHNPNINSNSIVIAGGVAANQYIKAALDEALQGYKVISPPLWLCTDNAAMIAWAGVERLNFGFISDLNFEPRSRWPIDQ